MVGELLGVIWKVREIKGSQGGSYQAVQSQTRPGWNSEFKGQEGDLGGMLHKLGDFVMVQGGNVFPLTM